jgi:4-hydroxy-3-methylbut-2-enyl diphosphate reductase
MTQKKEMTLVLASARGFCAGVERAVVIVEQALEKYGRPVYVRHEIVHNKYVVDTLKEKGAIFVEELDEVPIDAPVIFSAHGVPKSVPQEANRRNMTYIDATCPLVSKVHLDAQRHYDAGRKILLIGHAGHPEVIGTTGQLPQGAIDLIETIDDAQNYQTDTPNNLAFVTQTTLSADDTADIIKVLQIRFPNIVMPRHDDICYATTNRQQAVKDLAKICDAIIVIGAENSSNSVRLVEVAKKYGCHNTILIPDAHYIECKLYANFTKVGITAGASAPEILVQELIKKFQSYYPYLTVNTLNTLNENVHFKLPKLPEKI